MRESLKVKRELENHRTDIKTLPETVDFKNTTVSILVDEYMGSGKSEDDKTHTTGRKIVKMQKIKLLSYCIAKNPKNR